MSLSKLTQATAGAIKEIATTKGKKLAQNASDKTQVTVKKAKGCLDALAAQGKAMVKKFDTATDKMANKITSAVEEQKQFDKSINEIKTFCDKVAESKIEIKKTLPHDKKLVLDGDQTKWIKSAKDSAEIIDSLTEGLANKSAQESAKVIMKGGDIPNQVAMRERLTKYNTPEMKAKKAQMDSIRELKAKYADKLK